MLSGVENILRPIEPVLRPLLDALGIGDTWVLVALVFFPLTLVFLALFIVADVWRRHWKRTVVTLQADIDGMKQVDDMWLQPLSGELDSTGGSVVFKSAGRSDFPADGESSFFLPQTDLPADLQHAPMPPAFASKPYAGVSASSIDVFAEFASDVSNPAPDERAYLAGLASAPAPNASCVPAPTYVVPSAETLPDPIDDFSVAGSRGFADGYAAFVAPAHEMAHVPAFADTELHARTRIDAAGEATGSCVGAHSVVPLSSPDAGRSRYDRQESSFSRNPSNIVSFSFSDADVVSYRF